MVPVIIALGSNVGDRLANLQRAVDLLSEKTQISKASRIYETAPMYVEDQPVFHNAALLARTELPPHLLLRTLKQVEASAGRKPAERYGPREIDIDLVAYGAARYVFREDGKVTLEVPHPRTPERRFVLAPLHDLEPRMRLPCLPHLGEMLEATRDQADDVRVVEGAALRISA